MEKDIDADAIPVQAARVRKVVRERVEVVDEPMLHDEVDIEHVAINRPVAAPEPPREEGDVLVIPVYEEIVTVQRQWVLKEEIRLRRREVQSRYQAEVTLRAEEALIERSAPRSSPDKRGSTQG